MICSLATCVFLTLCLAAACAASDKNAAVADASCSASIKPSDANLAVTQTALLACSTVLEPTGALDWLIDVQQVRLRDVLDGRFIHAVEQPAQRSITLAELVQQCWPGTPLLFRVFLSDADKESHSRTCASASAAAADVLHSPVLGLTRAVLSFDSLPTLPIIIAACALPHVAVAVLLFTFAPAAIVAAPLWSLAVVLFALIDLYHTPLRAAAAFRSSTNRFLTFFLRRLFARVAVAFVVAPIDSVALSLSACTFHKKKTHFCVDRTGPLTSCVTSPQPPVSPFFMSALLSTAFITVVTTGSIEGCLPCIIRAPLNFHSFSANKYSLRSPWRVPIFVDSTMTTFDFLWRLLVTSASAREAALRLQQRVVQFREEVQKKQVIQAFG
jgi:hypothetical protein